MPPQLVWPCGQEQTPAAQEVPTGQVRPQTPQLVGSVCRSRQKPLQTVWPVGHCGWQAPLTQSRPEPQRKVLAATLQPPQLFGSLFRSRQKPPQFVWPTGQLSEQVLPTQLVPPGQTLPQAPQLFGLLTRLTQLRPGPQLVWPCGQMHAPPEQKVPAGQTRPQAPQLLESTARSRQVPRFGPQSVWPVGQSVTQLPARQLEVGALQTRPQAPQLALSEFRSRQTPLHGVWPTAHPAGPATHLPSTQMLRLEQRAPHEPQLLASVLRLVQIALLPRAGQRLGVSGKCSQRSFASACWLGRPNEATIAAARPPPIRRSASRRGIPLATVLATSSNQCSIFSPRGASPPSARLVW